MSNGSDRGSCDVTVNDTSCQAALNGVNQKFAQGDPCKYCSNVTDNTREWNGSYDDIQGGPCQGFSRQQQNYTPIPVNLIFRQLHIKREAAAAPTDNSIPTCEQECAAGSPFCLRLQIHSAEQAGLLRLRQALMTHPTTIKAADMLAMFNMSSDPCARSDTTFDGGNLENHGLGNNGPATSCELETQLPNSKLTIRIPELLEGKWAPNGPDLRAVFDNPQTRAHLEFTNPLLNSDWGGDINGVFSNGNNIGFSVGTKSCIRANLN